MDSIDKQLKASALRKRLKDDLTVADFQWSLFVAALSSYKQNQVVRPFPPMFFQETQQERTGGITADNRDFKTLEREVDKIKKFQSLLKLDLTAKYETLNVDLLYWCLHRNNYSMKLCKPAVINEIQIKTGQNTPTPAPDYIFEVTHSSENDATFQDLCGNSKLLYGYHGSNIENFYSIVNYGLQGHLSKNALFGEGTYLSSELAISLQYSPNGQGWEHSILGDGLSCVAVCEMIDHPSVKCQIGDRKKPLSRSSSRSQIAGSEGGEIPETYYVVRNNDMMRVKYLLLYVVKSRKESSSWFHRHKFAVAMFLYVLLLVIISLCNTKNFWSYTRRYLNQ